MIMPDIQGYDYGTTRAARSPITLDELRELEATVGWTDDDNQAIAMAAVVLAGQEEAMVDSWRAIIGDHPFLAKWFFGPDGNPDEAYKAAVKTRFVQRVSDLCRRERHQAWLDYQEEIGLRHTPAKKNKTEEADTPDVVPLRYVRLSPTPSSAAARFPRVQKPLRRRGRAHAPSLGEERAAEAHIVDAAVR
jgi:hypothetical protein